MMTVGSEPAPEIDTPLENYRVVPDPKNSGYNKLVAGETNGENYLEGTERAAPNTSSD